MSRDTDLLRAAADALSDGRDPFDRSFLVENQVTLDEVCDLGDLMALGARIVAWGLEHPEQAVAALNGAHLQGTYEALRVGLDKYLGQQVAR
jgi:hypothetical protein